jgi:hypothetical protein
MLNIISNGSKWGGELPDSIEALFDRLKTNTLDPTFEAYGNFVETDKGVTGFFGNFYDYSHVFQIETTDKALIKRLTDAIRANQQTKGYADARKGVAERKRLEVEYRRRKDAEYAEQRKYRLS